MKAVTRRLHRLERRLAPQADAEYHESLRIANLIRERRRRRLEAGGEAFNELPMQLPYVPGKRLGVADTLRLRHQRA
jgi:hypothetical protein